MSNCEHKTFQSNVSVGRITADETPDSPIIGFMADIKIRCSDCGKDFYFVGVETGVSSEEPRVSVDGTELRTPISPIHAMRSRPEHGTVQQTIDVEIVRAPRP